MIVAIYILTILAWNDLQLNLLFMQSYQEFPNLRGIFGASQKTILKVL